jgi:DNA-binding NarL/FixJ family response regulator
MAVREAVCVLLAERHDADRRSIVRAIKSEPRITVADTAASGYEAITKTIRLMPNIALINSAMETKMAGVFACKEICANAPNTNVILYGKNCTDDIIYKAFQMGAANFVAGDFTQAELVRAILDAFDGKASIHHGSAAALRGEFKRVLDLQDNLVYVLNVVIKLTPSELNILKLLYNGMNYNEAVKVLFIGTSTMKTHVSHILKKFNLDNMAQVISALRSTQLFSLLNANISDL